VPNESEIADIKQATFEDGRFRNIIYSPELTTFKTPPRRWMAVKSPGVVIQTAA